MDRELSRLLVYLNAGGVVARTLDLLDHASTQEEQIHYIAQLRHVRRGWALADRERFFGWWLKPREALQHTDELPNFFADVDRSYVDGAWVNKYLREFRADALATLTPGEQTQLAVLLNKSFEKPRLIPSSERSFIRHWTMADLEPDLQGASARRNHERGRRAFVDAQCLSCHQFGSDGGNIGPELTGAVKYDARSLLESILEPSKVINEQYRNTSVLLKDGASVMGRLITDSGDDVVIEVDPANGTRQKIKRSEVKATEPSHVSPMPAGLVNVLSKGEILDLLAYLQAGARSESARSADK